MRSLKRSLLQNTISEDEELLMRLLGDCSRCGLHCERRLVLRLSVEQQQPKAAGDDTSRLTA